VLSALPYSYLDVRDLYFSGGEAEVEGTRRDGEEKGEGKIRERRRN